MKAAELTELSLEELAQKLEDLRQELFNLKFQHSTGQLENPMRVNLTKKDIARVLTFINQRQAQAL
ncbi:MAG: 50S ribosomal protein L29 [Desulfarculus sp.]|nr:50S ribosomal protein L29 [Pseudomonadota bacterium]MBV1716472.1 50S ribosomal protein L29 [Desulfarculus sp.]MBU4573333.1 50S ribosomal protein L29 [Pseudomonadota bacterium]MBU4599547.1 50S ribosomal protein L29 [Pseudomonadota bacterium]MBV1738673.1 50S ribosomal protein L29 [Desulfarculus sp.]